MNHTATLLIMLTASIGATQALAADVNATAPAKVIQVASVNQAAPTMTHQIATLMQMTQAADAQYRRSGQAKDQAYAQALRNELASRGFGRITVAAPAADTTRPMLASAN